MNSPAVYSAANGGTHLVKKALGRFIIAVATLVIFACPARALVSSNTGPYPPFTGIYINQLIGADAFYSAGFFGINSVVANVEAGSIWNGHESLGAVSTYISDPELSGSTSSGQFDWHATMVGQVLGGWGYYTYQDGIAPSAQIWSASIATEWTGTEEYVGSFSITDQSIQYAYETVLSTGVGGRRADVLNSSWGYSDPTGYNLETVMIDGLLASSDAVGVFSAGNEGPAPNTVGSPAAGFNGISVGALTGETDSSPFMQVADFSSRGPGDFYNPQTHELITGVRPVVDLMAPGDNLTVAFYAGVSGGHISGTDATGGSGLYYIQNMAGTSFAAPIVAGGVALMQDAAYHFGNLEMRDARLIKAVLLTSAAKTAGWDNGQQIVNGVIQTDQGLDYVAGAGRIDLASAFDVFIGNGGSASAFGPGTTPGVDGVAGGDIKNNGWDLAEVAPGQPVVYAFQGAMQEGWRLTLSVVWQANRTYDVMTNEALDLSLDNIALQLWLVSPQAGEQLIAESDAPVSTVEHLFVTLPVTGNYKMRVLWMGEVYDLENDPDLATVGVAWRTEAIPEPGTFILFLSGAFIALQRRRPLSTSVAWTGLFSVYSK